MDLTEHLRLIFQRKWLVLGASLAVALLVFGWRTTQPKTWSAASLIDVVASGGQQSTTATEESVLFTSESYAELATTRPVLARAGAAVQPPLDLPTVEQRAKTSSTRAGYIDIVVTGPTPAAATQLADALAQAIVDTVANRQSQQTTALLQPAQAQITELENRLNELGPNDQRRETLRLQYEALVQNAAETRLRAVDRLSVVAPAHAADGPVSPHPKRDALVTLIVALVVNSELAVFLVRLGDRFGEEDVAAAISAEIGLPVLAEVPQGDDEQMLEGFNSLRTNLMFMQPERLRSVAVVGGESGVGKTFVAVNLAKSIGRLEVPVVLIDGDLRRPAVHERLGTTRAPGLKEMLDGKDVSARPVPDVPSLQVLPAGAPAPDPARLLVSNEFRTFLESLSWAETVIIDTPPTGPFADAVAIGLRCDAVILVVDSRRARRRRLRRVTDNLRQSGVNLLGVVVNRTAPPNLQSYYRSTQEAEVSLVR
jgi:capsular exopolysaccharide synthesis family protein